MGGASAPDLIQGPPPVSLGVPGFHVDIDQVSEVWLANTPSHSVGCLSRLLLPFDARKFDAAPLVHPACAVLGRRQEAKGQAPNGRDHFRGSATHT